MNKLPIAIQLFSIRKELSEDFEGALRQIKEMGYDGVEFAGTYGRSVEDIKKICEEIGLIPISAHLGFNEFVEDPNIVGKYAEIGCKYVVVANLIPEYRPNEAPEKLGEYCEMVKKWSEVAKSCGLTLCHHNHDYEFTKIGNKCAIDIILESVPAELFQPEFDTCWINVGGYDPVKYLEKYAGRIDVVHFKDFVGANNDHTFSLKDISLAEAGEFEFRPNGHGIQDTKAIYNAAVKSGAKWIIVEQDVNTKGKTALECAKLSIEYLKSL